MSVLGAEASKLSQSIRLCGIVIFSSPREPVRVSLTLYVHVAIALLAENVVAHAFYVGRERERRISSILLPHTEIRDLCEFPHSSHSDNREAEMRSCAPGIGSTHKTLSTCRPLSQWPVHSILPSTGPADVPPLKQPAAVST